MNNVLYSKSIGYKEWAIYGKKHAFTGLKLKGSITLFDVVKSFCEQKCKKIAGVRIKNTELYDAFDSFVKEKNIKYITTDQGSMIC